MEVIIILIIVGIIGGFFYAILYPFIWIGQQIVNYQTKEDERINNALTYTKNEKQLYDYIGYKNILIIKEEITTITTLTKVDGNCTSISLSK